MYSTYLLILHLVDSLRACGYCFAWLLNVKILLPSGGAAISQQQLDVAHALIFGILFV
jgi:hypothetical protein